MKIEFKGIIMLVVQLEYMTVYRAMCMYM